MGNRLRVDGEEGSLISHQGGSFNSLNRYASATLRRCSATSFFLKRDRKTMRSSFTSLLTRLLLMVLTISAFDIASEDRSLPVCQTKSLWSEDDEKIFVLLRESDPRLLKAYIDVLASSKTAEKRLIALESLAYDRIFPDAPEVFGLAYRVNHIVHLLTDDDVNVRHLAKRVLTSLLPSEVATIIPLLQQTVSKFPADSDVRKELTLLIQRISQEQEQSSK